MKVFVNKVELTQVLAREMKIYKVLILFFPQIKPYPTINFSSL